MYASNFLLTRSIISLASVLVIAGCTTNPNRINTGTETLKLQSEPIVEKVMGSSGLAVSAATAGTAGYADAAAVAIKSQPVAKRATGAWYGQRMIPVLSDATLPPVFKEIFAIDFDGYRNGRVSIAVVAERLSRMSGVPVRVSADVYATKANQAKAPVPVITNTNAAANSVQVGAPINLLTPLGGNAGLLPTMPRLPAGPLVGGYTEQALTDLDSVSMKWNGTLERFLDHVTAMLNLSWSYRDGGVVIERFVTESFEITAFGGTQDYKMSLSGGNGGNGGNGASGGFGNANASLDVNDSGKLAALDSLKKSLDSLVGSTGGSVTLNEGSGRFTVVATKDVLSRVREIIRAEDTALRRQAHIQLDIYSVTSKANDEYGVDWSGFMNDLAKTWAGTLSSPASLVSSAAAGVSYTLFKDVPATTPQSAQNTAARYGGSKVLLQALHQMGDSTQYRPVSLIAMNRQWARKTSLLTTGYVSETTPSTSSSAGSGAPGLKTSSVTTGDKFLMQPAIMADGTIFLKFGVSLTDLIGLFNVSAGAGASLQTVQTPETTGTDDQGTIRLQAGEAMVITGLSRRISSSDRNALAEELPIAMGGSKKRSYRREDFLVIVRVTPI